MQRKDLNPFYRQGIDRGGIAVWGSDKGSVPTKEKVPKEEPPGMPSL